MPDLFLTQLGLKIKCRHLWGSYFIASLTKNLLTKLSEMQAHREPQRDPGNHYRGALSQPHSVFAEMGETWVGVSPHHPTRVWGSVVSSHSGVRGGAPSKMDLCIFEARKRLKKPSRTPFSVFLSDGRPPNVAGPGKLSPCPPIDGPAGMSVIDTIDDV